MAISREKVPKEMRIKYPSEKSGAKRAAGEPPVNLDPKEVHRFKFN
jgi:hypothetical protein